MKFITLYFVLASFFLFQTAKAAKVDTVETYSQSMNKRIKAVVITPDNYIKGKEFPVVYLLHGYGGDYSNWVTKAISISEAVDTYQLIIVCPDGNNSWYFDSPVDPKSQYETYISTELVNWVDKNYKTVKNNSGRAIAGLSMGGHGALFLALKHQDIFGAAGSMSGGLDIRPFPKSWNLSAVLGIYAQFPERWDHYTVINMLHLLTPGSLKLIIDCGTEDFFFKVNQNLHEKLLERNIPHDFTTRPGGHSWAYWTNSINYQLLFMSRFFNKKG